MERVERKINSETKILDKGNPKTMIRLMRLMVGDLYQIENGMWYRGADQAEYRITREGDK